MSRRKAREIAVQTLFHLDFNHTEMEEAFAAILAERNDHRLSDGARQYAHSLVCGIQRHQHDIDAIISRLSSDWKIDRMAAVDRNIARLAVFEMKFAEEQLIPNVAINEAVDLAKLFGTEDSSRFLNGILGMLVKESQQSAP